MPEDRIGILPGIGEASYIMHRLEWSPNVPQDADGRPMHVLNEKGTVISLGHGSFIRAESIEMISRHYVFTRFGMKFNLYRPSEEVAEEWRKAVSGEDERG